MIEQSLCRCRNVRPLLYTNRNSRYVLRALQTPNKLPYVPMIHKVSQGPRALRRRRQQACARWKGVNSRMNLSSWSQPDMAGGLAQAKSNRWARVREMAVLMITSGWMESSVQLWYGALGAVGTRTFVRYHVRSGRGCGPKKKEVHRC